ncbi:MAG: hypothetical protein HQ582_04695 [Planctomycetes bacterium]|nr:hypothetical protein [Planctomycetota bacterium]
MGKTHLCWLLASVCQERALRCLIVDLDQQANITQSFLPDHTDPTGVEQVFEPTAELEPSALVRSTSYEHIDVLPVEHGGCGSSSLVSRAGPPRRSRWRWGCHDASASGGPLPESTARLPSERDSNRCRRPPASVPCTAPDVGLLQ